VERPLPGRYRVLDSIRRHGPISRVEIADVSGLSPSAVTAVTRALLAEGWIRELSEGDADGGYTRGRPRVMLAIEPGAANVIGVKLSLHQMSVAVTDFSGDVLHTVSLPFNGSQPPDIVTDLIELGVRRCLKEADIAAGRVLGLCVAIPGYINHDEGLCYWSPVFDRNDVALGALLGERLPFETAIENDANMVTLAEHWFGKGRNLSNFAVVTVEHGVGMGLVTHDRLYRGAAGIGPEFGHAKVSFDGRPCRCGQLGCVEAYASDYAILREVLPHFRLDAYVADPRAYYPELARITAEAEAGNNAIRDVFAEAGRVLGRAIGNLVATLNPPAIIVTGDGLRAGEMMFGPMQEEVRRLQLPGNQVETEIILHGWGDDVWARGAAALVLQEVYSRSDGEPAARQLGAAPLG